MINLPDVVLKKFIFETVYVKMFVERREVLSHGKR